eukprot:1878029-Heterocapsa_arctica.AAC.1
MEKQIFIDDLWLTTAPPHSEPVRRCAPRQCGPHYGWKDPFGGCRYFLGRYGCSHFQHIAADDSTSRDG